MDMQSAWLPADRQMKEMSMQQLICISALFQPNQQPSGFFLPSPRNLTVTFHHLTFTLPFCLFYHCAACNLTPQKFPRIFIQFHLQVQFATWDYSQRVSLLVSNVFLVPHFCVQLVSKPRCLFDCWSDRNYQRQAKRRNGIWNCTKRDESEKPPRLAKRGTKWETNEERGNEVKCRMQERMMRIWSVNKFDNMTHALFWFGWKLKICLIFRFGWYHVKINRKASICFLSNLIRNDYPFLWKDIFLNVHNHIYNIVFSRKCLIDRCIISWFKSCVRMNRTADKQW